MKSIIYFLAGMLYMPVMAYTYVTGVGETVVNNIKFNNRLKKGLKRGG